MKSALKTVMADLAAQAGVPVSSLDAGTSFARQGLAAHDVELVARRIASGQGCILPAVHWAGQSPASLAEMVAGESAPLAQAGSAGDTTFADLGFVEGVPDEKFYE